LFTLHVFCFDFTFHLPNGHKGGKSRKWRNFINFLLAFSSPPIENELLKKKQTEGKEKSHSSFIFGLVSTLDVPMHCSMRHRNLLNLFVGLQHPLFLKDACTCSMHHAESCSCNKSINQHLCTLSLICKFVSSLNALESKCKLQHHPIGHWLVEQCLMRKLKVTEM